MKGPANPGEVDRLNDLQRFEAANNRNGLLMRYCAGRPRYFGDRQMMTLIATFTIAAVDGLDAAFMIFALSLGGDAFDTLFLRYVWHRHRHRPIGTGWRRAVRVSGALQALSVAAATAVAWFGAENLHAEFFATAFTLSAIINAGMIRPFDALTSHFKVFVLGFGWMTMAAVASLQAPVEDSWLLEHAIFLLSIGILAYTVLNFIATSARSFTRRQQTERDLLRNQLALEASQRALTLREAQARRLALVAEQANDAIIICDPQGRIEWVNDTFTRVTGYTPAEATGQEPGALLGAPESDMETVRQILDARMSARPHRAEIVNCTREGRNIWIETSLTPVWNLDGTHAGTIQVERDITEAKLREADLARANAEAYAAAEARTRFLATMSHEIRTPMNGVIGMADLLSRTDLTAEQRGFLDAITDSGEALLNLINDILDLTKLQSGKVEVAADAFDVVSVVSGVTTLLGPIAARKGIDLTAVLPTGPMWRKGDAGRLRQVLLNLIGNAIKFTTDGGVRVRLWAEGSETQIAVADTGIGIAPERLGSIFDAFTQADGAITRAFGGTGLGLTISRMLARAMGGDVLVVSTPGEGSVFTLRLPLPAAQVPAGRTASQGEADWPPAHPVRVLLAEDNATNRLILQKMIAGPGVTLDCAENGAEAVARYRAAPPDLVVMDMQMPVMDGLTAIRRIREAERSGNLPRCPIIVLTANAFREDERASLAADADAFQTKPVKRRVFLQQAGELVAADQPAAAFPAA